MNKIERELITKVQRTILRTPTGDLRNLLTDVNIMLQLLMKVNLEDTEVVVKPEIIMKIASIEEKSQTGILVTRQMSMGSVLLRASDDIEWVKLKDVINVLRTDILRAGVINDK